MTGIIYWCIVYGSRFIATSDMMPASTPKPLYPQFTISYVITRITVNVNKTFGCFNRSRFEYVDGGGSP